MESLSEEELKEVLTSDLLSKLNSEPKPIAVEPKESDSEAKENIFGRLKDLGIERFNDVKDSISETVSKMKEKKEVEQKVDEKIESKEIRNNPFLKMQKSNNSQ